LGGMSRKGFTAAAVPYPAEIVLYRRDDLERKVGDTDPADTQQSRAIRAVS